MQRVIDTNNHATLTGHQVLAHLGTTRRVAEAVTRKLKKNTIIQDRVTTNETLLKHELFDPNPEPEDTLRDAIKPLVAAGAIVFQFYSRVRYWTLLDSEGAPLVLIHLTSPTTKMVTSYDITAVLTTSNVYPSNAKAWSLLEHWILNDYNDNNMPSEWDRVNVNQMHDRWKQEHGTRLRTEMVCWTWDRDLKRGSRSMEIKDMDDTHAVTKYDFKLLRLCAVDANHKTLINLSALTRHVTKRTTDWFYNLCYPLLFGRAQVQNTLTLSDGAESLIANIESRLNAFEQLPGRRHRAMCRWHAVTKVFQMEYGFQWRLLDGGIGMTVYAWVSAALFYTVTIHALHKAFNALNTYINSETAVPSSRHAINSALAKAKLEARAGIETITTNTETNVGVRLASIKKVCMFETKETKDDYSTAFYSVDWKSNDEVQNVQTTIPSDDGKASSNNTVLFTTLEHERTIMELTKMDRDPKVKSMFVSARNADVFNATREYLNTADNQGVDANTTSSSSLTMLTELLDNISPPGPKNERVDATPAVDNTIYQVEKLLERHDVTNDICIWLVQWFGFPGGDTYETQKHLLQSMSQEDFDSLCTDYIDACANSATGTIGTNKHEPYPKGLGSGIGLTPVRRAALKQWIAAMYQKRTTLAIVLRDRQPFVSCNTCGGCQPNPESWTGPNHLHTSCTRSEVTFSATKRHGEVGHHTSTTGLIKVLVRSAEQAERDFNQLNQTEPHKEHRPKVSTSTHGVHSRGMFPNRLGQKLTAHGCKQLMSRLKMAKQLCFTVCICKQCCKCAKKPDAEQARSVWKLSPRSRTNTESDRSAPWLKYTRKDPDQHVMLTASNMLICSCPYYGRNGVPCEHMIALIGENNVTLDDFTIRWGAKVQAGEEDVALWTHFTKLQEYNEFGINNNGRTPTVAQRCAGTCTWSNRRWTVMDEISAFEDSSQEHVQTQTRHDSSTSALGSLASPPKEVDNLHSVLAAKMNEVCAIVGSHPNYEEAKGIALDTIQEYVNRIDEILGSEIRQMGSNGTFTEPVRHGKKKNNGEVHDKRYMHRGEYRSPTKKAKLSLQTT